MDIIIATHSDLAKSLYRAGKMLCGEDILKNVYTLTLNEDSLGIAAFEEEAKQILQKIKGNEILILTDLFGASPFNVCSNVFRDESFEIITAVNLPILIEVLLNKETDSPDILCNKAIQAGISGIRRFNLKMTVDVEDDIV